MREIKTSSFIPRWVRDNPELGEMPDILPQEEPIDMANISNSERQDITRQHLESPCIGDYWHDMLAPVLVVVAVNDDGVFICDKTRSDGDEHWTWDCFAVKFLTREAFRDKLGYTKHIWVSVEPRKHEWVRAAYLDLLGAS